MANLFTGYTDASKFDATTHRALKTNADMLERAQLNRIDPADRASVTFKFQISGSSHDEAITTIPLARVCETQWRAKYNTPMPAHAYIQEIRMGSYRNHSNKSMVMKYNGEDVQGSFVYPTNTDQDAEIECALWVADAENGAIFDGDGQLLHSANSFVRSDAFAKYKSLLSSNFQDSVAYVDKEKYALYQSHCRHLVNDIHLADEGEPDLVASMIGANEEAFTHNVYTTSFVEEGIPGSSVAFKMIAHDWESLCQSVKENVEGPLRLNTYDLTAGAKLNFVFCPIRSQCMNADGEIVDADPSWTCGDMSGHENHNVSAVLAVTMAFA